MRKFWRYSWKRPRIRCRKISISYYPIKRPRARSFVYLFVFKKIGKFFFIFLDSGEDKPDSDIEYSDTADFDNYRKEQAQWLEKIVNSDDFKNAYKRIIITHIPPTWGAWHGSINFRKYFSPVLKGKKIDVIFSGHLHGDYLYFEPSEDFDMPCVVNSNMEKIKVKATKDEIICDFYDIKSNKVRTTVIK